jgi:hypothetical protein
MRLGLLLMFPITTLFACNIDEDTSDTTETEDTAPISAFEVSPSVGGRGTSLTVQLTAVDRAAFKFGETSFDLGEGITVVSVTVQDGYNAVADIVIDPDAELGARDATLTVGEDVKTNPGAFAVIGESFKIDPDNAKMGETVDVAIVGQGTEWEVGYTWPGFGDDVDILDFQILSPTLASARVAVHPDARPGKRDVNMEQGPHVVTLYDGFLVDRAVITGIFDPKEAYQGDTVEFTIDGLNTAFIDSTRLEFWDDSGKNADVEVAQLTVLDATHMYGRMRLSNAARLGMRDVLVSYGGEAVLLPDAFEVKDAPPDLSNVYVGTGFDVSRQIDNADGTIFEQVSAIAYFLIPLDPPCGSPPPPASGPMPYDMNGVFPSPPEAEPEDCPNPETVSAGDFVWFEGPENVVPLAKNIISSTGQIIYLGENLVLDDYHFDTLYALHTQGDPDGIPEVTVPDVQPTVPADYYLLTPNFWGDLTVKRSETFDYTWTPAQTYPDAVFSTSISGTITAIAKPGFAGSIPWDDGVHAYSAAELSQLDSGPVSFSASSYIKGPYFGLPFSTIQSCQSDSTLGTGAQMILE